MASPPRKISSYDKSLGKLFPQIASELVDKSIDPFHITAYSNKKYEWVCSKSPVCLTCNTPHIWFARVYCRTGGTGCPFCAPSRTLFCRCKSLGMCFPEISAELLDKSIDPFKIAANSHQKYNWVCSSSPVCPVCETPHIWTATVNHRACHKTGCPFCNSGTTKVCRCKSLGSLYPTISSQLTDNTLDPFQIASNSGKKYEWICPNIACAHKWYATVAQRTSSGTGCPVCCVNKAEAELDQILSNHPLIKSIDKETFLCYDQFIGKNRRLKPDAVVTVSNNRRVVIELDGAQHFETVFYYNKDGSNLKDQISRDLAKNLFCYKNGYSLLRISYLEYHEISHWVNKFIEQIIKNNCQTFLVSSSFLYNEQREKGESLGLVRR